ncbi:gag protein domain-containing protein [Pandoravirus kuranda]|uniref:Gag protein domain-containing protein n=1 Tax=Pandoravirus kuranda TaxID=3019033 RepID=A0AA95EFF1_9VIRU|nr:gag protein domain-containing protein [Pandoravirus kuranda]
MSFVSAQSAPAHRTRGARSVSSETSPGIAATKPPVTESTVAGFIVPGLVVVELQRVPYADPLSSLGTHVSDIVVTAARNLKGAYVGDVRLMAAYIMDRRAPDNLAPRDPAKGEADYLSPGNDGNGGCDDICTLLCVASSSLGGSSHWVGLDMQCSRESACPRGRRPRRGRKWFSISVAPASLIGCFTRHATINASGIIDRKEADAAGCATCARTWSGFTLAIARTQSRERVNAARLAALTAASLQARRSFRCEAGIVDVLCAGVIAVKEVAPLIRACDPRLQRAERALSALARYVEGALMLCLWADRFDATEAKRIIGEADARAASALPEAAPRLRRAADVLDSVVAVAVAAGVIVARANVAAADAVCAAVGFNGSPVTFTHMRDALSSLSLAAVLDQSEEDMADWARRASACFMSARKATIEAGIRAAAAAALSAQTVASEAMAPDAHGDAAASRKDQDRREARHGSTQERDTVPNAPNQHATAPNTIATSTTTASTVALPCASSVCRAEGRRIVSGCVVTVECDAHCSVSFHRACWEAAHIALETGDADSEGAPCATPDCQGRIVRVTSARLRAVDRPQRILWQAEPRDRHRSRAQGAPSSPSQQSNDQGHGQSRTSAHNKSHRQRQESRHDRTHQRQQEWQSNDPDDTRRQSACTPVDGGRVEDDAAQSTSSGCARVDSEQRQRDATATRDDQRRVLDRRDSAVTADSAREAATTVPDAAAPLVNATPYQKQRQARERLPLKRKRPRDRTGRRQRCHVAAQQRQQLLVMAGLAESLTTGELCKAEDTAPTNPSPGDAPAIAAAAVASATVASTDDALWPCFFVPDPV